MRHTLLKPVIPRENQKITWSEVRGSGLGLSILEAAVLHRELVVVVVEDQHKLEILESEINFFNSGKYPCPVARFPGWECLPYDVFSPHQDIISDRLKVLASLPQRDQGIILVQTSNLMQKLPPREFVTGHSFSLQTGQSLDLEKLKEKLADANYISVNQVISPGEFAVRGGVVDIFAMGSKMPFRLDLYDDELETIRYFDPDTQRSTEKINRIDLLPAREFPMTRAGIDQFRSSFRKEFEGDPRSQSIYNEISSGHTPAGTEFFFPLFFQRTETFFDYISKNTIFIVSDDFENACSAYWAEIEDRFTNANYDARRRVLPPERIYLNADAVSDSLSNYASIELLHDGRTKSHWKGGMEFNKQYPADFRKASPYRALLDHLGQSTNRILLIAETIGRRETLDGVLRSNRIAPFQVPDFESFLEQTNQPCSIAVGALERGFTSNKLGIEIICESQLYGEKVHQRRRRGQKARDPEAVIKSLVELNIGDPVVHIEHGVGRYIGMETLEIADTMSEFLVLAYRNEDKLYVPVLSLNVISRYTGGSAEHAPLHRLGGDQWEKSKKRAREKAYDAAAELLEIEAIRCSRKGNIFSASYEEMAQFAGQFPFEETPDQQRAIDEVTADLQKSEPMDRLICGDVGFGKTEVALRASFIVANCGKQTALLAPTTLLAQQHYQTFVNRFSQWPINIAVLSRFNTKKQSADIISRLKAGEIDIVIGTHRLLQEDIRFSDLGLLIIDEEHRFGVRQKERLKRMRSQVDILTLTATPIPRTLNISMAGLRDISIIAVPPLNRISIKTFVRDWNRGLVREACLREIRRGGQVFFLHNDVRTIESAARELAEIVPEAKINIGHGQMPEIQLERIMQGFYHQHYNILVCSTIIESGIDIPTANTIIINRADRFGLAQLHQLRGRVGRSHHQAFAYLLIPGRNQITGDAVKRLDAIESMEDLGAGFALASHDLEVRGAGELLGETQSGAIDDIGFSLYNEYLSLAVKSIKGGGLPEAENALNPEKHTQIDLHLTALFPDRYLSNIHTRLMLYKRIANAEDMEALEELKIETIDRFGLIPEQGNNLFRVTAIRLRSEKLDIRKIDLDENGGLIEFHDRPIIDPDILFALIQQKPDQFKLSGPNSIRIRETIPDAEARLLFIEDLLNHLQQSVSGQIDN